MTKVDVISNQLEIGEPSVLVQLGPARYLNHTGGLIQLEDLPDFEFDPEKPITVVNFMCDIGRALADEPRRSDTWDGPLDAHGQDFIKAQPDNLDEGLYFDPQTARDRHEVVTVGQGLLLKAPGARGRKEGVAVSGQEYRLINRNPPDFAKHIHAIALQANAKRPPEERLDDETERATAGRAMAHALLQKKEGLWALDKEVLANRRALMAINALAKVEPLPLRPMERLEGYRQLASAAIHATVNVASQQLGYGTTTRQAVNRAIVSAMHRGNEAEVRLALLSYSRWAGCYMDAKRGKIHQSASATGQEFKRHMHHLPKPEEQAAED